MPSARWNTLGQRQVTATAWKAPIEAPVVHTPMSSLLQSCRIAGTTSWRTYWWNWLSSHIRWAGPPSWVIIARPATLSHE